ncbi:MAG: hypothetical protein FWH11_00060 [Micrococcales bacterium]|nr:hypothetical protein [Micrococcales bacterium]
MLDNVGNLTTPKKIADTLVSSGRRVTPRRSPDTSPDLTESYALYEAKRYGIRGKRLLENTAKYYTVDTGLRAVPDHYPRLLLTTDPGTVDHDSIRQTGVYDWLLDR